MKVAVIGTGYVGLVNGAGFADFGHDVACVDIDATRVAALGRGEIPIHEPGLPELVKRNVALGRLTFTTDLAAAVSGALAVIIAVPTPAAADGAADLTLVLEAARQIARALDSFAVVITKSTVPVGTAARLRELIGPLAKQPVLVASNPEFLKEGDALNDFLRPARVVVGTDDPRALDVIRELYRGVMRTGDRLVAMDTRSAELTKYAANAMLATRISFMNELARLAEAVGADIEAVRAGIGSDPRIGPKFLFAGPGFGGSCFPKDLRSLIHTAHAHDIPLGVIEATARANERQKRVLFEKLARHFAGVLEGKRIALWGLAFKPDTDDIREAPALALIDQLRAARAQVVAYDPIAMPNAAAQLRGSIELARDAYEAARGADALILVTEWHELRNPDFARLAAEMRTRVLIDGRNVWSAVDARRHGFTYCGVGRA